MTVKQNVGLRGTVLSVGIGALISVGIAMVLLMLVAALVLNETVRLSGSAIVGIIVHVVSAYIGCYVAGKKLNQAAVVAAASVLAVSILFHIVMAVLVLDASVGRVLQVVLPESVGCGLAILSLAGRKNRRKTRKVTKRYL